MHTSTIILWLILLILGLPMALVGVSMFLVNNSRRDLDRLEQTEFVRLTFEQFPWYVRKLLSRYRDEAAAGGFRELAVFSRPGFGSPNFCCVMISSDRLTYAEIEYVRLGLLNNILLLIFQPKYFLRHPLGIYGMVLATAFGNNHRLLTTKLKFLTENKRNDKEYQLAPPEYSFRQLCELHITGMQRIASERAFTPKSFNSAEEFFDFEKQMIRRLVSEGRADIERASEDID